METRQDLISWIMLSVNSPKISRACKRLGINDVEVYTEDHQDFLNKEFLEILLNEYESIRRTLHNQMDMESTMEEHQWLGGYYPCDIWTEAEIELNTVIDEIADLIEML